MSTTEPLITVQLKSEDGTRLGAAPFVLPRSVDVTQLQTLCNQLIVANANDDENEYDRVPYAFYVNDGVEIKDSLANVVDFDEYGSEKVTLNAEYYSTNVDHIGVGYRLFAAIDISSSMCYTMYEHTAWTWRTGD